MFLRAVLALALAATVIPQTVEQLADRSTTVVRAVVRARSSAREPGPAGIYTRTTLQVEDVLKGHAGKTLVLRQPGGTVGTESVELVGDATLREGERVLAFLRCPPRQDTCTLVGLAQGKFHLDPDGRGGFTATRDFHQTSFVRGPPPSAGPEPYGALARRIRAHVGTPAR